MELDYLTYQDIQEIFADVSADQVPSEYIEAVAIKTIDGEHNWLTGDEFQERLKKQRKSGNIDITQAKFLLKVDRAKLEAHRITKKILRNL